MVDVVQTVVDVASPAQIRRHNYLERAVLTVNGQEFYEWETISVMHAIDDNPAFTYRFTCSEQTPFAEEWAFLRIRPGDYCTVHLDGWLAMTGFVLDRHVYFDANQHTVEILGATTEVKLSNGAVQSKTGELNNVTIMDIAQFAAKPYGITVSTIGAISQQTFDRVSVQPGETAHAFVKRYARQAQTRLSSNIEGHLVLMSAPISSDDFVIEGNNILEGREVIHSLAGPSGYAISGQAPGNNETWGATANLRHQTMAFSGLGGIMSLGNMPHMILSEIPAWSDAMLKNRGRVENNVDDANQITVTVRVLGWQRPIGGLWERGQLVYVRSPMLIMDRQLTARRVTFEQDDKNGTTTELELMNGAALGGYSQ